MNQEIPVELSGYRLTVVEAPVMKVREDGSTVTDRTGAPHYVVSVFAKRIVQAGERAPKGEEIRVTLETDPGDGYQEGLRVELISPRVKAWEIKDEKTGRFSSGLAFKALGLKPGPITRSNADK